MLERQRLERGKRTSQSRGAESEVDDRASSRRVTTGGSVRIGPFPAQLRVSKRVEADCCGHRIELTAAGRMRNGE